MLTTHHSPSCARSASRVAQAQHGRQAYYYNCTSTIVHYIESNSVNIARVNITRVGVVSSRASGREAPLPSARASLTPPMSRAKHHGNINATSYTRNVINNTRQTLIV